MIRFRPLLVPTLWFVSALALLIGLGVWQLQRLQWKEALITRVESRTSKPAIPLEDALSHGLANAEWRHVSVRGTLQNDDELYLFAPSNVGQPGYHVVAPMALEGGSTVLIDRGFVPEELKNPAARPEGRVEGAVTVTGVLRLSQAPGLFTPAPDQANRVWYVKEVPSMAEVARVTLRAPIIIEADATSNAGEYPKGGQTRVDFPNNHLQYAITWFGLALALAIIYLLYHRKQGRLRFGGK
jgi:surfeit locus 1 family protein